MMSMTTTCRMPMWKQTPRTTESILVGIEGKGWVWKLVSIATCHFFDLLNIDFAGCAFWKTWRWKLKPVKMYVDSWFWTQKASSCHVLFARGYDIIILVRSTFYDMFSFMMEFKMSSKWPDHLDQPVMGEPTQPGALKEFQNLSKNEGYSRRIFWPLMSLLFWG